MIIADPLEMTQLTQHWLNYLSSLRLKLLLYLNAETVRFLFALRFKSCEENFEEMIAYSLTPFCDVESPEYTLTIEVDNQHYELNHFTNPPRWRINSQTLDTFFKLNQTQTNFLATIFYKFDSFVILTRLRTDNQINRYKEKYLQQPLVVNDVIHVRDEFFLVLDNGHRVKLMDLDM